MKKAKIGITRKQIINLIIALYTGIVLFTALFLFIASQETVSSAYTVDDKQEEWMYQVSDCHHTMGFGEEFVVTDIFNIPTEQIKGSDIIINNLNTQKLGESEIEVEFVNGDITKKVTVYLTVVDSTSPTINLTDMDIGQGEPLNLMTGVTATDNVDGNLTNKVIFENDIDTNIPGLYTVIYSVEDSSKNVTKKKE